MYVRAGMNAFLDPTAGKLDTISAEPLRVWHVTGTDEAMEAFRIAVGGIIVPEGDVVAVKDAAVMAVQVAQKTEQVAALQKSLDAATAELTDLRAVIVIPISTKLEALS